ncbi:hypothetical protein HNQ07_000543 [Deinococcus metalli]|uniref:DUF4274 domain-containing protein n=1 Tax=Deinococcus metalli TaxID=1141878 RepID=A0A7W8KBB6_9DEIO|nr:DUF4274 domain-containing protein [Deinococcus metalli]MBB5375099.1 hypothetical protein [Deinococcus metalli]GHF31578.1 hypothetical protein GCM10017781_04990 [Deinococcus metalli]
MGDQLKMMKDFLSTASAEEWFFVATTTNYDDKELLHWMVDQPICPQAAAHAIYWMMGPGFYTKFRSIDDVSDWAKPTLVLLRDTEKKFADGFYAESDIGFDPSADSMSETDWVAEYPESAEGIQIPTSMKVKTPGRKLSHSDIPEGWDDGMPPHVVEAVWKELDKE